MRVNFLIALSCAGLSVLAKPAAAQQVRLMTWPEFEKVLQRPTDTTYVFNFWATWCKPCLAELPTFESARKKYAGRKVQILLVSLDFVNQFQSRVVPFVQQRKLVNPVVLLNEKDQNSLIDRIDRSWTGSLPMTLIINNQKRRRKVLERPLNDQDLSVELGAFL